MITFEELKGSVGSKLNPDKEEAQTRLNKIKSELEEVEELRRYLNGDSPGIKILNELWERYNSYYVPDEIPALPDDTLEQYFTKIEDIERDMNDFDSNFMNN